MECPSVHTVRVMCKSMGSLPAAVAPLRPLAELVRERGSLVTRATSVPDAPGRQWRMTVQEDPEPDEFESWLLERSFSPGSPDA